MTRLTMSFRVINTFALLVIAYALLAGPSYAEPDRPNSPAKPAVELESKLTYWGRIAVADGTYDVRFRLWDAGSGGAQIGSMIDVPDVVVKANIYSVSLDFGSSAFFGEKRFLEVNYRPGTSTGAYTKLARVAYLPTAYALYAPYAGYAGYAENATNAATAINASFLGNHISTEYMRGYGGIHVTSASVLAAGATQTWTMSGYETNQMVVWSVRPNAAGGRFKFEVETEYNTSNHTYTYHLHVSNTGSAGTTYEILRQVIYQ